MFSVPLTACSLPQRGAVVNPQMSFFFIFVVVAREPLLLQFFQGHRRLAALRLDTVQQQRKTIRARDRQIIGMVNLQTKRIDFFLAEKYLGLFNFS